jgi:hypothetical protein
MKIARLKQDVVLEESGQVVVSIEEGQRVEVIREYFNPDYKNGLATIIFDGKEACSVSSYFLEEVTGHGN